MEPMIYLRADDVRKLVTALESVHDNRCASISGCNCMEVAHRVVDEFKNQTGMDL